MPAPAAVLGRIERHVGLLEQLVGIGAVGRRHGNADRGANIETVTIHFERLCYRPKQALREPFGVLPVIGAGLHHDEFVAAKARDQVARPNNGAKPLCNLLQQLVADRMAERIVDGLEAVEVDQLQRDVALAATHGAKQAAELFVELNPVREPREVVIAREIGDALLGAFALGDILKDHHRAAVGHHAPRQRNGLFAVGRNLQLLFACRLQAMHQLTEHLLRLLALVVAGADAVAQQLR